MKYGDVVLALCSNGNKYKKGREYSVLKDGTILGHDGRFYSIDNPTHFQLQPEKTGRGWLESGVVEGDVLVAVTVCTGTPAVVGREYPVYKDRLGRLSIEYTGTNFSDNLHGLTATTFTKKESTMFSWGKPLQLEGLGQAPLPCTLLVGRSLKGDYCVVELEDGSIYAVNRETRKVQGKLFLSVSNRVNPVDEAFDRWEGQPAEHDYSVKATFLAGWEAALKWKEVQCA
jgi:hypothetical protein